PTLLIGFNRPPSVWLAPSFDFERYTERAKFEVSARMPRTMQQRQPDVPDDEQPATALDQLSDGYMLLDDAVIELADGGRLASVAALLAERTGLLPDTIMRALQAQSEEPVTVLCRAAGLGVNGFSAVLRMRRRDRPREDNPAQALTGFLDVPLDTARRVASMMKVHEGR